jgi:uncharacterized protein (TIGR02996 family)
MAALVWATCSKSTPHLTARAAIGLTSAPMPRYEFAEGSSSKFWEITLLGKSFTTKFGKIGSAGQTKIKDLATEAAAKAEYEKLIAEKTKKGYALVGNGKAKAAKPAKAEKAAKPAKGQYFEFKDGGSSKFWEIALDGTGYTVRFGKIGTDGQVSTKSFKSKGEARAEHDKLVGEKTKKGYKLVRGEAPAGPAVVHARNDKLEAAIEREPDDADAYLVYADWLQSQGDPRGELIVLQHANKKPAAKKLLEQNKEHFFGKMADARDMLERYPHGPLGRDTAWRWGYLESLWISNKHDRWSDYNGDLDEIDVDEALGWLLDHPSCRFLRELTVGVNTFTDNGYAGTAAVIGKRKLPTLRKLILGDFYYAETELNWSHMGDVSAMYKAMPNLESLTLRSGTMRVGKIDLPNLKELVIITGGFDKKSLASICAAKWPKLETLNIQLGDEDKFSTKLLQPIFDGKAFPKVKHLGLGNSNISDDIAKGLASSKIAAQLESLDLSKGTLGDAGATALAAGRFPKLQLLDVTDNWLSSKGVAALKSVAKKVESKGGREGQQDDGGEAENRYIAARE